jgi:hypothetical protein
MVIIDDRIGLICRAAVTQTQIFDPNNACYRPLQLRDQRRFLGIVEFGRCWHRPYSITSSATESSVGGTAKPSAFAVLRLITNSNLVVWTTGRSAGFAPLRILPA